jgi:AcrR family transcriptional regulator
MVHVSAASGPAARREARRQAIVDEALALVTEGGFEALTLQRLAGRLGYAVGALYRYFPSKEALLAALQEDLLGALAQRLERAATAAADPALPPGVRALAGVLAAVRVYVALPEARPEEHRMISFAVGDPRVLVPEPEARRVLAAAQPILLRLAGRLAEAEAAGALAEGQAGERAVVLWAGLHGVLQTRKLGRVAPELTDTARLADTLVQGLLRGWGAPPQVLDAAGARVAAAYEEAWLS